MTDPIKRNNLPLLSRPPVRVKSSKQLQLSTWKNNSSLFFRLYIASQVCNSDLDEFFRHNKQACPPSLSQFGVLRSGTKSDVLKYLEDVTTARESASFVVTCTILDGAAIVMWYDQVLQRHSRIMPHVFLPYITS